MKRKPYKIIERDNGSISLYGNHHWKEIEYDVPEWGEEDNVEGCFTYEGNQYFISEFMSVSKGSPFYKLGGINFDGHKSDSFFSGVLIVHHEFGDAIKVYTYIS